jgi:hypothetical protein
VSSVYIGAAVALPFLAVGLAVLSVFVARWRHIERMADKKIETARAERQKQVTDHEHRHYGKKDRLENDVLVDRLMKLLQINGWGFSHKADGCRAELVNVVQALLDATGERP